MSRFMSSRYASMLPYVPGEQPRDRRYIKLNTNESPFPPSPAVLAALKDENALSLNLYSDPTADALVRAIAKRYTSAYGNGEKEITPDMVFAGNGSDEVLAFAFAAFGENGVAFPEIGYGFYPVFAEFFSLPAVTLPMRADLGVDVSAFKGRGETIVIANPNAQTGVYIPVSEIKTLLSENKDRVVIVDEAYCDFGGESAVPLVWEFENLLVVRTMSKSRQLAGGRVGYAIGDPALISDIERLKFGFNPYNISRTDMAAGVAALSDEEYFSFTTGEVAKERERLKKSFSELGCEFPDSLANFLLVRHEGIGGEEMYLALKKRGVLVRYLGGKLSGYVRITVGSARENDVLLAAVKDIIKERLL